MVGEEGRGQQMPGHGAWAREGACVNCVGEGQWGGVAGNRLEARSPPPTCIQGRAEGGGLGAGAGRGSSAWVLGGACEGEVQALSYAMTDRKEAQVWGVESRYPRGHPGFQGFLVSKAVRWVAGYRPVWGQREPGGPERRIVGLGGVRAGPVEWAVE